MKIQLNPFKILFLYLNFSLIAYMWGPWDWPNNTNKWYVFTYVIFSFVFIYLGYLFKQKKLILVALEGFLGKNCLT